MKKSIGIILMVLLFLSMATGLGIAIGALVSQEASENNTPYIKDGNWWIGDTDTGVRAEPSITIEDGYWCINGVKTDYKAEGEDGSNTVVTIGEDGYWYINGVKTDVKAEGTTGPVGPGGHDAEVTIGEDGYWYINGIKTNVKAEGLSVGVKVEDGWLYVKQGDGAYEPSWNLEYSAATPEECAKVVVDQKVDELEALLNDEQSDAVKEIIEKAIEEVKATDTTAVDSVDKLNQLVDSLEDLISDTVTEVETQVAKEVTVIVNLESVQIEKYIVEKGTAIVEPTCQAKEGYTLQWYCGTDKYDFATLVNDDLVINGVYEANTYSIEYYVDGNKLAQVDEYKFGEDAVVTVANPEKEGYTFIGWVDVNNAEYVTIKMPVNGITLYANFEANTYVVDYDLNYDAADLEDDEVVYGAAYELVKPYRQGYEFVGWYYNGQLVASEDAAWLIASDVVLVAEWKGFSLNNTVESNKVKFDVTAIDNGQIENANTIEITLKVKTAEVTELAGTSLVAGSKDLSVKSSVGGEYTVYVVTFYAEGDLTVATSQFAELVVTLADGVDTATLEVVEVAVSGSGEYLGAYDVEYNSSIVVERN